MRLKRRIFCPHINKGLFTTVLLASCLSVVAQQRFADMEVILESPQPGSIYNSGTPIPYIVTVFNHGPNDLITGDTLFFYLTDDTKYPVILDSDIANGDRVEVINMELRIPVSETTTGDICAELVHNPSTQVVVNGSPVEITYTDPDSSNNKACSEITIEAGGNSIIGRLPGGSEHLAFYPNPVKDRVTVLLDSNGDKEVNIRIWSVCGKLVMEQAFTPSEMVGLDKLTLSVSRLEAGLYLLEKLEGKHKSYGKLWVE